MPKTKKRYVIKFNEKNLNDRIYTRDSIDVADLHKHFSVTQFEPESFDISFKNVIGFVNLGIDDIGVYAKNFKFLHKTEYVCPTCGTQLFTRGEVYLCDECEWRGLEPSTIETLIDAAKLTISLYKLGNMQLVTSSRGYVNDECVVSRCKMLALFFTTEPSFPIKK